MKKGLVIFLCLLGFVLHVEGQTKPAVSGQLAAFRDLLATINATFTIPDKFSEIKPPVNERLPFQYGLKLQDDDCEIWFQVNCSHADWLRYEANKQLPNPDSLYTKTANDEALLMSGSNEYITRKVPPYILDRYNADAGRSYLLNLVSLPATKNYQYALLIVLHKNHYGNIVVACLTNEKGPSFFRNINKLKYSFRFND